MYSKEDLQRANKVTTQWEGEGIAVGTFYKTKEKLIQVKSDDPVLINAGFEMLETVLDTDGETMVEATGTDKLNAFREFLQNNATVFGVYYDPVDRRVEKYPSKYDMDTFKEVSKDVLSRKLDDIIEGTQKHINKLIEQGTIGYSELAHTIDEPEMIEGETYKDGHLKYADAIYPVTFLLGEGGVATNIKVSLVSGQLRKPRELAEGISMTQTGLKNLLIENGVLPKPEAKKKKENDDDEIDVENAVGEEFDIESIEYTEE